ncbi:MAG: Flp family type IVb pilin [Novosphingobium sp.]|nr:Flp family type IVb pilin [Novosphingobium sp.]
MREIMRLILRDNKAATAIEYGLIAALIVVAILGALNSFAGSASGMFNTVQAKIVPTTP